MTSIRLQGGLGNQLFQFAAGLYIADHEGRRVTFDRSWFDRHVAGDTKREFELEDVIPPGRVRTYPAVTQKLIYSTRNPWLVRESNFEDVLTERRIHRLTWLDGYFQHSKYACEVRERLLSVLEPRLARCPDVSDSGDIAIHVRLGDYYENPVTRRHHGLLEPPYFERALGSLRATARWQRILVFTDSPKIFEREYGPRIPGRWELATTASAWDTLNGMARCGAIVMANSSLSWWASFLASAWSKNSVPVVFPRPWFPQHGPADDALACSPWRALSRVGLNESDGELHDHP